MDTALPTRGGAGSIAGFWVRTADAEHRIVEMTSKGFVIAADTPPHLHGFAEILEGRTPVRHGLIVCSWSKDGHVGYEFKRSSTVHPVATDHVPGDTGFAPL